MDDQHKGWNQFRRIKLDRKRLGQRAKKAEKATRRHAHRFITRRIDNVRLVSHEITIWLLIIGALIAGIGVQISLGQRQYSTITTKPGGDYVEGSLGVVNTVNPLFAATNTEAAAARLIFSSLYNYDANGKMHQDLAKNISVDASHKIYTVTIRDDAKWHDGTPLTAQDIVFTVNLIKNPDTRSPLRVNWLDIAATAPDSKTVVFTLPSVYAAFPHALTFSILPQHLLKTISPAMLRESVFSQSPVGSGPFKFKRLQASDSVGGYQVVHMEANTDYYNGRPKLALFELRAYTTEDTIIKAVNAGELSGASDISAISAKKLTLQNARVTPQAISSGVYLLLNTKNPLLNDVKVRQALQAATDSAAIRKAIGGAVAPLDGPVLNSQITGTPIKAPEVNIAKAKTLLNDAGWVQSGKYRAKDGQPLEITITTTKDKELNAVLPLITEQWKKIGVKVTTNSIDATNASSGFVQNTLQARNFDVLLYRLSIGADPDVYAYWHSSQATMSGYNFSNYANPLADATLSSARSRLEPELRNAKYRQFVHQWLQDVPGIALYQAVNEYVSGESVYSVQKDTQLVTVADRYMNVLDWTVANQSVYQTP